MTRITALEVHDVRFPTSRTLTGSDAMNPDPDYSAAYVVLRTDGATHGHGLTFTIGRGTEVCVAAVHALAPMVVGRDLDELLGDLGETARRLGADSQLRWIGPEKGAIHLATGAVVNALWDLHARCLGRPLWRVLLDLTPAELVGLVDFRHLTDVLDPGRARELLEDRQRGRAERVARLESNGVPAYVTSVGWLGYDDERVIAACREALAAGWTRLKVKVGAAADADVARLRLVRDVVGPDVAVAVDANQVWEVGQAIERIRVLAPFDLWWVEEPTSPDDIAGHAAISRAVAPIRVATGEMCQNRVMFKQFLAAGGMQVCQLDACRLAGVNEALAVAMLAALHDVPVCPHAGGVGLCQYVQHLAAADIALIGGDREDRACEYAGHLHEWFVEPLRVEGGAYRLPEAPGFSVELKREAIDEYEFPHGAYWRAELGR